MKKVRIAVTDGIVVRAGDPEDKLMDGDYMDTIRQGGSIHVIPYSEYEKLKLYDPYPPVSITLIDGEKKVTVYEEIKPDNAA